MATFLANEINARERDIMGIWVEWLESFTSKIIFIDLNYLIADVTGFHFAFAGFSCI